MNVKRRESIEMSKYLKEAASKYDQARHQNGETS